MMVATWLTDWLILRKEEIRPRTYESYDDLITRYVIPSIGNLPVEDLRPEDVRHLLATIVAAGHTRTAELLFVLLRCAFAELDPNPMLRIKRPRHHQQSPEPWSDADMLRYLDACRLHPHGLALTLGLLLGLRRGEICGLRWQDIDLPAGEIHIRNQRIRLASGEIIDAPPKSTSSIRTLPIPDQLRPWLVKARGMPAVYICPLTPSGLDQAHRKLVARLALPHIPLHGLRHTMASASLRHGGSMRALQDVLGHSSYTTTANIYTHPDRDMLKSSLDAVIQS